MSTCPCCPDTTLTPRVTHEVPLESCPSCSGVTVELRHLIPLLEAMCAEWGESVDPNLVIDPVEDDGQPKACPTCSKAMERFGYMGTRLVHLDRCSPCARLWVDTEELAVVSELYARTNRRLQDRKQAIEGHQRDREERFDAILRARMVERFIVGGVLGGLF